MRDSPPSGPELPPRRVRRTLGSALALIGIALGPMSPALPAALAAGPAPASAPASPAPLVAVKDGRVTVEASDADLADVLSQLAERAQFRLATTGQLGRVTVAFTAVSLEQALRRLAQDHEVMLVYAAPERGQAKGRLVRVDVFAASPPVAAASGTRTGDPERAAALAEIRQLAGSPGDQRAALRLAELLGSGSDPAVRARAAWALGRVGGPSAAASLAGALSDQAPDVRVQAVYALRAVDGPRAIPALGALLLRDPDARVRRAAAHVLATLPDSEAGAALGAAARDTDPLVRREATRALQRRGSSPP